MAPTLQELVQGMQDTFVVEAISTGTKTSTETETAIAIVAASPVLPVAKAFYSHEAMVELMVSNPHYTHTQFAAHFGRHASWTSAVLASDAFQQALELRRHEIADPSLTATMEERFRALALRSVTVLQEKLNTAGVSDLVILKAAEIGVKALGMGNHAPIPVVVVNSSSSSETVADRLLAAMDRRDQQRTIEATTTVFVAEDDSDG